MQVTDDKTLPKQKRKELQIVHAGSSSERAKNVKLADKLYNLQDLERCTPEGWDEQRVQEYFKWAHKVVTQLKGTNHFLENKLEAIFKNRISN